ncbi:MAG: hypothetical protein WC261_02540, partial [Synergistaceae bacterium]
MAVNLTSTSRPATGGSSYGMNPYDKPISQTPAAQQVIKPTPPPAEYELPSTPPPAPAPAPAYINPYDKPISQTPAAQQVIKPTPPPAEYHLEPPVVNIYNPATGLLEEQPRAPLYGQTPYDKPISQTPAAQQVIKPTPPPAEYHLEPPVVNIYNPATGLLEEQPRAPLYGQTPYDKPISQTPAAQQVIKPTPPPAEYHLEPPVVNIYNPATGLLEEQPRAPLYGQ